MDLDAWLAQDLTSDETREAYKFFMRPEPKDVRSELMTDEETGQRYRLMAIGMVRNASEDQKKVVKVFLDPIPHIRIENAKPLQGWYKGKNEDKGVRARPCFTDAILTEPYGGFCAVGCAFCYVNSGFRGYRGTGLISVPMGYGAQLREQLRRMRTSAAGYFSSFTDPFLPLESVYHNTEEGARAFVDEGLPIFFLSRLRYPGWAYDLLSKNNYSYAQKSINTPNARDWKLLSPGAASLADHMDDIKELRRRGIYVSIQVNPIVPGVVTHDDVEATFEMLASAGANHVIVKFVEAGYSWAPAMVERIKKRFGAERGATFEKLFVQNIGGQKTIAEDYRMEGHARYKRAATRHGLTYATCYEYRTELDAKGKPLNKVGVSIGRDFLTADQCHGHRVPMFTRSEDGALFREVEDCPPTGCLYCADDNEGTGRCGSPIFEQAPALRTAHLQQGVFDRTKKRLRVML
jgi:DNA repair photolyase